jgi:hypothetical protein
MLQDSAKETKLGEGALSLTTKRLIFERDEGLPVDIPLSNISAMMVDKKRFVVELSESEAERLDTLS